MVLDCYVKHYLHVSACTIFGFIFAVDRGALA